MSDLIGRLRQQAKNAVQGDRSRRLLLEAADALEWKLIESAPKQPYQRILGWRQGWENAHIVMWKENSRIPEEGWYYGDPNESDDYDMVMGGPDAPTHWAPIPPTPQSLPQPSAPKENP